MAEKVIACNLTLDEIKGLAKTLKDNGLGKIKIKNGDSEIVIEGKMPPPPPMGMAVPNVNDTVVKSEEPVEETIKGNVVKSPIVGTFYSSPSPDKAPFVKIGDTVKKGDVIMIIESMKLMNEVQSDFEGKVLDILVDNGQTVEYDQPIMIIG